MKKILCLFIAYSLLSCNKDISSLNVDKKNPATVPSYTLFSSGLRGLSDLTASPDVNLNIFRLVSQHWTETTYTDESNYSLNTRNIPNAWWGTLYTGYGVAGTVSDQPYYMGILKNLDEAKKLVPKDVPDAAVQKNQIAIIDMLQVYGYSILVNTFGNVPYSQALDYNNLFPKYDDAKTIYVDLLKRLDADINAINTSSLAFSATADLLYGGNVSNWKKFGNSLKMKLGIILSDSDPALAKSTVESANAGSFTSNSDNAIFNYYTTSPNTNPVWEYIVPSGRGDFVASTTILGIMQPTNDPRIPLYFTTDKNGNFSGGVPGDQNVYADLSHPGNVLMAPDFHNDLLDYSEIEFIRAEAIERGLNIPGTAEQHYNNAITASILYWGGTQAQAGAYLAQPSVAYSTAPGNYKQKIGTQKWLALFNRGFDAWTEIRRLDYPVLPIPVNAQSGFPVRFTYPISEQNINTSSYNQASSAIGGDLVTTKLFWDKY
jgi:Formylmethanofuran dehydrogenase subunit B